MSVAPCDGSGPMKEYVTLLVQFAPEIIISAILSFYLNRYLGRLKDRPFFYISSERLPFIKKLGTSMLEKLSHMFNESQTQHSEMSKFKPLVFEKDVYEIGISMLSVSAWFLIFLVTIGISKAGIFFPYIPGFFGIVIYGTVTAVFALALISSLGVRFITGTPRRTPAFVLAVLVTVAFFFLPSTVWILDLNINKILLYALIYSSVLFVAFASYIFWWYLSSRTVLRVSIISSMITYAAIVAISLLKLILLFR